MLKHTIVSDKAFHKTKYIIKKKKALFHLFDSVQIGYGVKNKQHILDALFVIEYIPFTFKLLENNYHIFLINKRDLTYFNKIRTYLYETRISNNTKENRKKYI